jgi:hypothetical protein
LTPLDRALIFQLYAHYPYALDKVSENGQAFADLFTPDGELVGVDGKTIAGHDKLVEFAWTKGPTDVKTYIANIMIDAAADGVNVRTYMMNAQIPPQPKPAFVAPLAMSFDRLVKTPQGWRFKRKTMVAPHAIVPQALVTEFRVSR